MEKENKIKTNNKSKKWYENLKKEVVNQFENSNSIEELKKNFSKAGYKIKITDKTITLTDKENLSVRLKTLDKTYTNEYVFEMFEKKGKELIKSENDDKKNFIKKIGRKRCYRNSSVRCPMRREFYYVKFATRKF
ncbi:hypothetical protein JMUB3935_0235 [Leptotrichia trevisanii]|jgi:hypothetical protein|uniref:Uncharacterized protein n=1 Tax=Leptotrichia trevisanii TaxID=109328 RepID=A0A510KHV2_9FUSO|nr:relaxase/mobilization nuclease domain-containing protein [Leptotrichia trevisanii]BBM44122.1 hypothetical protein JMUB3870_0229 [Leptotrichia trevisanii]BBM51268.1 hypothetical protein JMUB3935_0235 [Leptotrichia trevisanii]